MNFLEKRTRKEIMVVWLMVIVGALYLYFFKNDLITAQFVKISVLPVFWLYLIYFTLGCLRGFILIPVTYFIIISLIFLPAWPAYILTMAGVMVSSTIIYYFSEYLSLGDYFKRHYPAAITKLTFTLKKYELPIIIGWSFSLLRRPM